METTSVLMIMGVVIGLGAVWIVVTWSIRALREYLLERAKSKPERRT